MVSDHERHGEPARQRPEEPSEAGERVEWPDRSHFSEFDAAIARSLEAETPDEKSGVDHDPHGGKSGRPGSP